MHLLMYQSGEPLKDGLAVIVNDKSDESTYEKLHGALHPADIRGEYLQLHGEVGRDTFGFDRWLNQDFYQSREWRQFRDRIIARDIGCDLGCKDHPITDWVLRDGKPIRPRISIHHINPITKDDVLQHSEKLLDPENAICVSAATHKAIHYGTGQNKNMLDGERKPGDTCPWRK